MDENRGTGTTPRWASIALLGIFVFTFWIRLSGIDWLLPYLPEPDNVVPLQLETLEANTPPADRSDWFRRYPLLMARATSLIPAAKPPATDDLAAHLRAASTVTLRVRIVNAVLSSVLVLLTWRLARRFISPAASLLACAFVATSLLDLLFSQQGRPHGTQATLSMLAVLVALRLRENPTWRMYALAGLACGLAFTLLHNGLATIVPLFVAHLLRERGAVRAPWWRIAISLAIFAGMAVLLYPSQEGQGTVGTDPPEFIVGPGGIQHRAHRLRFMDFVGYGFGRIFDYLRDHDPALLVLAPLGLALALPALARRWKDKDLAVVLSYAVPYLVAIGLFTYTWDRFLLPILAFLACLAGYGVARVAEILARTTPWPPLRPVAAAAAVVAALAFPVSAAMKFASVRDAPDTIEQAAAWIREHVDPEEGNILVAPALTMPLFHDPALLDPAEPPELAGAWVRYQAKLPPSPTRGPRYRLINFPPRLAGKSPSADPGLAESLLEEYRPAYAVLEISKRANLLKTMVAIADLVRARGERVFVAASEPEEDPLYRPLSYQDMPHMLSRLLRVDCFGPRIEIWRLRRG